MSKSTIESQSWSDQVSLFTECQINRPIPSTTMIKSAQETLIKASSALEKQLTVISTSSPPRVFLNIEGAGGSYLLQQYADILATNSDHTTHRYIIHRVKKADHWPTWSLDFESLLVNEPTKKLNDHPNQNIHVLFLDDFERAHRNCLLQLAYQLLHNPHPLLIVLNASRQAMTTVLEKTCESLDSYDWFYYLVDHEGLQKEWMDRLESTPQQEVLHAIKNHTYISSSDRLRLLHLYEDSQQHTTGKAHLLHQQFTYQKSYGELDLLAALLGPQIPVKVWASLNHQNESDAIQALINMGLKKHTTCAVGGEIYAFISPIRWIESFLSACQQAHHLSRILLQALQSVYSEQEVWRVSSLLKRLHAFQGQSMMIHPNVGQVEPLLFWKASRTLIQSLQSEVVPFFVLKVVSALGYEWSQLGIQWGRWRETEYVLQNSILATQRMKDLWGAARLLMSLGQVYLYDRKEQAAIEALESSLVLSTQLQKVQAHSQNRSTSLNSTQDYLVIQTFILCAEAQIQAGLVQQAWKRLQQAKHHSDLYGMSSKQIQSQRYNIAIKKSLLALALNQHRMLVESWQDIVIDTLPKSIQQQMYLLLAHSYSLHQDYHIAQDVLQKCDESPLKKVLLAYITWKEQAISPLAIMQEASVHTQSQQDLNRWFSIQHLRALSTIDMYTSMDDSIDDKDVSHTQKGIERGIQVAMHLRDRLQLIILYFDLAQLLYLQGHFEASYTAYRMAYAWSNTLEQAYTFDWENENNVLAKITVKRLDIETQVQQEVENTLQAWMTYSLSTQSKAQQQASSSLVKD